MKTSRIVVVGAAALSLLAIPLVVKAGHKVTQTVDTDGSTYASGSVGDARNSGDTTQYIGCGTWFDTYGGEVYYSASCFARDSAGTYFSCYTEDSRGMAAAQSAETGSFIQLGRDDLTGECTYVYVINSSYYRPKTP